jgi:GTP-binding protein
MKIKSAQYIISAFKRNQYPVDGLPEIAFAGRSNVGKSSLMNALLNRKKLVKTSATPGKTQSVNYFLINEAFYFVDLPGFGYAKVAKSVRETWGPMMDTYFRTSDNLRAVVCLVDCRRGIGDLDDQLFGYLSKYHRNRIIVFTKFDKLKSSQRGNFAKKMEKEYGLLPHEFFTISSPKKLGIDKLFTEIDSYLTDVS